MPFVPGISGNPSGRPKVTLTDGRTLAEVAREHTAEAIAALAEIASNKAESASARVSAATALLDRGWGRPKQAVEIDVQETYEQRMRRLGSTPPHLLSKAEAKEVHFFFFGDEPVETVFEVEPVRYLEHQPDTKN